MSVVEVNQPWCAGVAFAAGDATKVLKATPGAAKALVVTKWHLFVTTAAAQAFDLEDDNGTAIEVGKFPASLAVGSYLGPNLEKGIQLTTNKNLIYKPAAAGPAGFFIVEGYVVDAV